MQIDEDALEEIDIRWQVAMITARIKKFINKTGRGIDFKIKQGIAFDKSKIECFNCLKPRHFARECKFAKYQANKTTEQPKVERKAITESKPTALVAQETLSEIDWGNEFDVEPVTYCQVALEDWSTAFDEEPGFAALEFRDGLGSFDWSMENEDAPVQLAMMATSPSSSNISEVCSKCSNFYQKLLKEYETERDNCRKARSEVACYQLTLDSMEAKILTHEHNEVAWAEKYEQQDYQLKLSEWKLGCKVSEIEKLTKERDDLLVKLASWKEAGLSHASFIKKQRRSHVKTGLGYDECNSPTNSKETLNSEGNSSSDEEFISLDANTSSDDEPIDQTPPEFKKNKIYNSVPLPTGFFQPPRTDVSSYGVDNLEFRKKLTGKTGSSLSDSKCLKDDSNVQGSGNDQKSSKEAVPSNFSQRTVCPKSTFQNTAPFRKTFSPKSQAGCSSSMTGDKKILSDFRPDYGGRVAFGNDL